MLFEGKKNIIWNKRDERKEWIDEGDREREERKEQWKTREAG